jgi:hypothetical protein
MNCGCGKKNCGCGGKNSKVTKGKYADGGKVTSGVDNDYGTQHMKMVKKPLKRSVDSGRR